MLLDTPWSRIEAEAERCEWQSNPPRGQNLGEPDTSIVGGYLHEEDRVWCIRCAKMAHLGEESSRNDKQYRENEEAECYCWQCWVVFETDNSANSRRKVLNSWVIIIPTIWT